MEGIEAVFFNYELDFGPSKNVVGSVGCAEDGYVFGVEVNEVRGTGFSVLGWWNVGLPVRGCATHDDGWYKVIQLPVH